MSGIVDERLLRKMGRAAYQVYAESMYIFNADDSSSGDDSDSSYDPSSSDDEDDSPKAKGKKRAPAKGKKRSSPKWKRDGYFARRGDFTINGYVIDGVMQYVVRERGCTMIETTSFRQARKVFNGK